METAAMNFRNFSLVTLVFLWADMKYGDEKSGHVLANLRSIKSVFESYGVPASRMSVTYSNRQMLMSALRDMETLGALLDEYGLESDYAFQALSDSIPVVCPGDAFPLLRRLAANEVTIDDIIRSVEWHVPMWIEPPKPATN